MEPKALDSFFSGLEAKKIHNISRYETMIEKQFYRSLKELREVQTIRQKREFEDKSGFGFVS